jgi:predicted ATPase
MHEFLGPYELKRLLGEGGMGQVYEGLDRRSGGRVAVKLLRGGAMATERERELFAREARVGMELDHPGLVKVLAVNIHDEGLPYLVMEYLPGPTLKGVLAADGLAPLNALAMVLPVLETLSHVHERGIVHRDVKSGNIMLDDESHPRLMDFGLTTFSDETSLSRSGIVFGSPHYMSPEQGLGESLDARSDLFSLCIVLFELLTGRLPFRGTHPLAVVYAIVNEEPPRLGRLRPRLPEALDWILARGLAKQADDRYPSAAALAADLRQVEKLLRGKILEAELELEAAPVLGTTAAEHFPLPLVGRSAELELLSTFLEGDSAGLCLVSGEAGVGKTRLVREALGRAGFGSAQIMVGRTQPGREAFPYQPWLEALRPILRERELERQEALAAYLAEAGEDASLATLLHPFLGGETVPGEAAENREQLFEALRSFLAALQRPITEANLVLWLEDLHRSDRASLDLLAYLSRSRSGGLPPILVSFRSEELPEDGPLIALLRALRGDERALTLSLDRLLFDDVSRLVAAALPGLAGVDAAARRLEAESGGNPFVLRELLEILAERPSAELDVDPELWNLPLPERLQDLVDHRLAGIGEEERELLELAAVEGEAFSAEVLAAVLEERKIRVLRRLQGLERRTRLVQAREGRFLFDHALVRRALYEGLGEEIRAEYHREVGEYLERSSGERAESAAAIARHFHGAGEERKALPYGLSAGRHARRLYAPDEARRHLERTREGADLWWLEEPEGKARGLRLETLRELGLLAQTEGRYVEAVELFTGAATLLTPMLEEERRAELERLRGECLYHDGRMEESAQAFESALAHCPVADRAEHARILRSRAYLQARGNDWNAAITSCETALLLSEHDPALANAVRQTLGTIHIQKGSLETARSLFEEVVRDASSSREQYLRTAALANLGTVLWRLGEQEEALRSLEESRSLRKRLGLVIEYAQILVNLAIMRTKRGELDEARALLGEAGEYLERSGDVTALASAESGLGQVEVRAGRLPAAVPHYRRAAELHFEGRNRARAAVALHNLGEVLLELGRLEEAASPLARSREIREELDLPGALASSLRAEARLQGALGNPPEADAAFARAAILAQSTDSPDEELKVSCERLSWLLDTRRLAEAVELLDLLRSAAPVWPPPALGFHIELLSARIAALGDEKLTPLFDLLDRQDPLREPYRRLRVLAIALGLPMAEGVRAPLVREYKNLREGGGFDWLPTVPGEAD